MYFIKRSMWNIWAFISKIETENIGCFMFFLVQMDRIKGVFILSLIKAAMSLIQLTLTCIFLTPITIKINIIIIS